MNKIYCFIRRNLENGWVLVCAIDEDGIILASHTSSSIEWAKHDIGLTSDWKHELYKKKYPNGYELVWLDDNDGFEEILRSMIGNGNL